MKKLLLLPIAVLLVFCFMAAPSVVLAQEYLGPGHSAAVVIGNRILCDDDPCVQPDWPLWGFWANMEDAKCLLGLENVMEDGIMGVEELEDLELPWNSNGPVAMAVDEENERLFVSYLFSRTLQVYGLDDDKNPYLIPGGLPVDIPDYHDVFDGEEYDVSPDEFWEMVPWFWPRFNLNRFCEIVNRFERLSDRITDPALVPDFGDAPEPPELNEADWEAIKNWTISTYHLDIDCLFFDIDLQIPYDATFDDVNVLTLSFGQELVDWASKLQDWITKEDGALEDWAQEYFDDIYSEMREMLCDISTVQSNLNTAVLALVQNDVNLRNNILMLWQNVATMREYIENLYALMEDKSVITGLSWVPETNRLYAVAYGLPWVYVYQYYNGEYVRMFDEEFSLCCDECLEPVCVEASNLVIVGPPVDDGDEECISLTQPIDIDVLDGKIYVTYREPRGSFCNGTSCICVFDIETGEKVDFQCPACQCEFEGFFSGAKAIAVAERANGCGDSETLIFTTNTGLCDAECAPDDFIHSEVSSWGYQAFPQLYLRDDLVAISCYEETPPKFQWPNGVVSLWNVENEAGCCLDLNVNEQACLLVAEETGTEDEIEPVLSYRWDAKGIDVYPGAFEFDGETFEGVAYVAAEKVTDTIHENLWINVGAGLFLIGYRFNDECGCEICEMQVLDYWETEDGNYSPADVVALDSVNLDFVIPDEGDKSGSLDGTPWIIDWEVCSPDLASPDVSISERSNPSTKDGSDVLFFGMDISNPENNICFLDAYLYVPCELEKEVQQWLLTSEWGTFANIEWEKAIDIEGVDNWKVGEDLFGCRLHIFYSKEDDGDLLDLFTESDIFGFGPAEFFLPELQPAPDPEPEPSPEPDTGSSGGGGCNAGSAGVSSILLLLPMLFLYFRK